MFFGGILKKFLKIFLTFVISFFIIFNIPYVQKKIIKEIIQYSNKRNDFKIQYDDFFIKIFHIINVKNLHIQKKDNTKIISLESLKININPAKLIFNRTISFSDLHLSSLNYDITKIFSKNTEKKSVNTIQKLLKVFSIEINNLQISNSHIFINKNIHFSNINSQIKVIKISNKNIQSEITSLKCTNEDLNIKHLTADFIFYFFKKSFFVKKTYIKTNYGTFEGSFNLNNLDHFINKNFKDIILNIKIKKAILKLAKINKKKGNISDLYFAGNLNIKNNILNTEELIFKYLQSFFYIKISAKNIFNYKEIKYTIKSENNLFHFPDFQSFFNAKIFKILNKLKICQYNCNIEGDFNKCNLYIKINEGKIEGLLNLYKKTFLERESSSQNFIFFPYIDGKIFFRNNNLDFFVNNLLNINSELDFNFDFLQKIFHGSLFSKKIQYKKYIFENIKYEYKYNNLNFNGNISTEDKAFQCNLKHNISFVNKNKKVDISGTVNSKYFLDIIFKKNIFNMYNLKFNVKCKIIETNDNINASLDIKNLCFHFLNYDINNEDIKLSLKKYNNNINFICNSNFYDIQIDQIPITVIKKVDYNNKTFYEILKEHIGIEKYKIKTTFAIKNDLFLNYFFKNKITLKNININGFLENKKNSLSYILDCSCNNDIFFYKKKIQKLKINNFLNINKNNNGSLKIENKIKAEKFLFMNNNFSFFNNFYIENNKYNLSLKILKQNNQKLLESNLIFIKNKKNFSINFDDKDIFLKMFNENIILNGEIKMKKNFIIFHNFNLNYKKKTICFLNGNIDYKKKKIINITANCSNINLKYFNFFFNKQFDGSFNCNIKNSQYAFFIKNAQYKKTKYGNFFLNGEIQDNNNHAKINVFEKNHKYLDINYNYYYNEKKFKVEAVFNNFDILKISPLTKNIFKIFAGNFNGTFEVNGSIDKPQFKGEGSFSNGIIKIKYINSIIKNISSKIICENNKIILKDIKATDIEKGRCSGVCEFLFKTITKPQINFTGVLSNFLLINNNKYENPYFYGTGRMSGNFKIHGPFNNIYIDSNLKTNKSDICFFFKKTYNNKNIHVMNSKIDFIKNSFNKIKKNFKSIFLNLNFNISKNLEVTLELDKTNKIITHGIGDIKINTDCENEFQIFGTYKLCDGFYNLNIYNLLNKYFTLKNEGFLKFYGDFNLSKIDINTETLVEDVQCGEQKQDLNLNVHFSKNLLNPEIYYSIKTLSGEEFLHKEKSFLQEKDLNKNLQQFINIILFKSLNTNGKSFIDDFFSSQINKIIKENILNKLSNKNFTIDIKLANILNNKKIKDKVKYKLSYKITDNLFFYKYGNFMDFNSLTKNMAFKWMFNKSCSALFTLFPDGENLETYNKHASFGFIFEI